ncbi:type II toxin-antitoxin system VapB family antitoxin [Nocardia sp. NPDC058666]|uniref:type II toxin-antitoxin system VapB family antitoxin n=1 Tax=Nocardia sp. NPDC058666 TaxID=3346587 RepID=UPI00364A8151
MSAMHIEIDETVLAEAMQLGGHPTESAAVAAALTEYNETHGRAALELRANPYKPGRLRRLTVP